MSLTPGNFKQLLAVVVEILIYVVFNRKLLLRVVDLIIQVAILNVGLLHVAVNRSVECAIADHGSCTSLGKNQWLERGNGQERDCSYRAGSSGESSARHI